MKNIYNAQSQLNFDNEEILFLFKQKILLSLVQSLCLEN